MNLVTILLIFLLVVLLFWLLGPQAAAQALHEYGAGATCSYYYGCP